MFELFLIWSRGINPGWIAWLSAIAILFGMYHLTGTKFTFRNAVASLFCVVGISGMIVAISIPDYATYEELLKNIRKPAPVCSPTETPLVPRPSSSTPLA